MKKKNFNPIYDRIIRHRYDDRNYMVIDRFDRRARSFLGPPVTLTMRDFPRWNKKEKKRNREKSAGPRGVGWNLYRFLIFEFFFLFFFFYRFRYQEMKRGMRTPDGDAWSLTRNERIFFLFLLFSIKSQKFRTEKVAKTRQASKL